jgi:hypothetical protein
MSTKIEEIGLDQYLRRFGIRLPEIVVKEWENLGYYIDDSGAIRIHIEYQSPYEKALKAPAWDRQGLFKEVERYLHWLLFPGYREYTIKVCELDQDCEINADSGYGYFRFRVYDNAGRLLFTGAVDGILDKEERAERTLFIYYPRDIQLKPVRQ